ncbi:MAG: hypothetical protein WBX25_23400, partial [Rhodomicrobium sp.]
SGRRLREIGDLVIGGVCAGFCRFGFRKEIGDGLSSRLAAALPDRTILLCLLASVLTGRLHFMNLSLKASIGVASARISLSALTFSVT